MKRNPPPENLDPVPVGFYKVRDRPDLMLGCLVPPSVRGFDDGDMKRTCSRLLKVMLGQLQGLDACESDGDGRPCPRRALDDDPPC